MTGRSVNYTDDALNRLATAAGATYAQDSKSKKVVLRANTRADIQVSQLWRDHAQQAIQGRHTLDVPSVL